MLLMTIVCTIDYLLNPCLRCHLQRFRYVRSIDGLRALSILAVMGFHGSGPVLHWLTGKSGWIGVNTFFVISGYLITCLLLDEKSHSGGVSLKGFYQRRALRIFPAYYFYLAVVFCCWLAQGKAQLIAPGLIAAFYLTDCDLMFNWGNSIATQIFHPWSLAVEEKFYLIFPLLFKLVRKNGAAVCTSLILMIETWKWYLLQQHTHWVRICNGFDTSADALLIGCLGGFAWALVSRKGFLRSVVGSAAFCSALLLLTIVSGRTIGHPEDWVARHAEAVGWLLRMPVHSALVSGLLLSLTVSRANLVSSILGWKPLVLIGKLSYSLYLWHTFGFGLAEKAIVAVHLHSQVFSELLRLSVAFVLSAFSYFAIEKPFLYLKEKLSTRRSDFSAVSASAVTVIDVPPLPVAAGVEC